VQRGFGERIAMNSPIQGTAADIIKIAMNRVRTRLYEQHMKSRLILQIHDELLIEATMDEVDEVQGILRNEMMHAAELLVPLEIDVHVADNWYDAK
jgi:DNA polymerase-1